MGFFSERVDSVSACSKKMYLTARRRANPSVITCSISILAILKKDQKVNIQYIEFVVYNSILTFFVSERVIIPSSLIVTEIPVKRYFLPGQ